MTTTKSNNLQDSFLNTIRKDHVSVTVFLLNGVKLQGMVTWFDSFCLLLKRDNHVQLVYKHAISTIMPAVPVNLAGDAPAGDAADGDAAGGAAGRADAEERGEAAK